MVALTPGPSPAATGAGSRSSPRLTQRERGAAGVPSGRGGV